MTFSSAKRISIFKIHFSPRSLALFHDKFKSFGETQKLFRELVKFSFF